MLTAALSTAAKKCHETHYPFTEEWILKNVLLVHMEFYSVIREKRIVAIAKKYKS